MEVGSYDWWLWLELYQVDAVVKIAGGRWLVVVRTAGGTYVAVVRTAGGRYVVGVSDLRDR